MTTRKNPLPSDLTDDDLAALVAQPIVALEIAARTLGQVNDRRLQQTRRLREAYPRRPEQAAKQAAKWLASYLRVRPQDNGISGAQWALGLLLATEGKHPLPNPYGCESFNFRLIDGQTSGQRKHTTINAVRAWSTAQLDQIRLRLGDGDGDEVTAAGNKSFLA